MFIHSVRVYWEDTDAGGVVYHAQYLAFLERARTEWLRARGKGQELLRSDHDLVFAKVDGAPIHPERFSREFDRRIERWALPRIRLHDLKNGWATMALQAGVNPKVSPNGSPSR